MPVGQLLWCPFGIVMVVGWRARLERYLNPLSNPRQNPRGCPHFSPKPQTTPEFGLNACLRQVKLLIVHLGWAPLGCRKRKVVEREMLLLSTPCFLLPKRSCLL